jgi:endogenous inhibitor of DNA gyrase (YacG/DUF329 family)
MHSAIKIAKAIGAAEQDGDASALHAREYRAGLQAQIDALIGDPIPSFTCPECGKPHPHAESDHARAFTAAQGKVAVLRERLTEQVQLAPRVAVAEAERDAATGALAEAMVVLSRLMDEGDVEPASAFRASPAADLAARHDAEIERRALLSAITFVWGLYAKAPQLSGSLIAKTMERKFPQALALLTPEKP